MGHDFCDWDAKPKGLLDFLQEFDMQDVLSRKPSPRLIPQVLIWWTLLTPSLVSDLANHET
jgi:hypothetical protein